MMGLFNFEQDGRYPLRRIPMIMRFKLDACGVKISIVAWSLLSRDERERLLMLPCSSHAEKNAFRRQLATMLKKYSKNPDAVLECIDVEQAPIWREVSNVPHQIIERFAELGLPALTLSQWQKLDELQRFALIKLTRTGHKNANLSLALNEFGIN